MYEGGFSAYLYAFGAFDGLHTADDTYYLQACAFIKCANNSAESCGQPTKHAESYIDKMSMQGTSLRHISTRSANDHRRRAQSGYGDLVLHDRINHHRRRAIRGDNHSGNNGT
ncbi:hypothetical protein DPMN_076548 [Dreissena polymorpha]|uniref:Vanin C-terminal domain-containing protein n=1 Tax=Dreissena polymorpha TaxID=45954 RepID=A0A9D3YMK2_DREPO|nr:hypothetical protein DPMN_076548 [Dreissena polymorpha]